MNKKTFFIALVAALVLGLLVVGLTSAQGLWQPNMVNMMGGRGPGGMGGRGMMQGTGPMPGSGPMHEAMLNALAEGLGLTRAELDARMAAGETPYAIAQAQGLSATEFWAVMQTAQKAALAQAVADGTLTQAQADQMLSHMAGGMGGGMMGAGGSGGMMGPGGYGGRMGTGTCPHAASATPAP